MKPSLLPVGDINIAYYELNSEAEKTLFFLHGNSQSKRSWHKQYNSPLLAGYRRVAIDLPAHGDSDAADTNSYTLPGLAKLMADVVRQLANGKPFLLVAASLATNIAAEMMAYDIEPAGCVLSGPCIAGKDYPVSSFVKPGTQVGVVFTDAPDEAQLVDYALQTSATEDEEDMIIFREDFGKVKAPFRSLMGQSVAEGKFNDEVELLQRKGIPLLVVFGKDEMIIDEDYLDDAPLPFWSGKVYKLTGASHLVHIDQPEAFNELLVLFAKDVFREYDAAANS